MRVHQAKLLLPNRESSEQLGIDSSLVLGISGVTMVLLQANLSASLDSLLQTEHLEAIHVFIQFSDAVARSSWLGDVQAALRYDTRFCAPQLTIFADNALSTSPRLQ